MICSILQVLLVVWTLDAALSMRLSDCGPPSSMEDTPCYSYPWSCATKSCEAAAWVYPKRDMYNYDFFAICPSEANFLELKMLNTEDAEVSNMIMCLPGDQGPPRDDRSDEVWQNKFATNVIYTIKNSTRREIPEKKDNQTLVYLECNIHGIELGINMMTKESNMFLVSCLKAGKNWDWSLESGNNSKHLKTWLIHDFTHRPSVDFVENDSAKLDDPSTLWHDILQNKENNDRTDYQLPLSLSTEYSTVIDVSHCKKIKVNVEARFILIVSENNECNQRLRLPSKFDAGSLEVKRLDKDSIQITASSLPRLIYRED